MAPSEYCRSGFHSGQSASGYFDESFGIFLASTDRTLKSHFDSLEIIERTGEVPNQLALDVRGFTPTKLQEIAVYNGGLNVGVPIFRGHLMDVEQDGVNKTQRPTFHLTAIDYFWLLDRYSTITKTYRNIGVSTMVGDILATYTNGGFVPGYLPQALGDITEMTFTRVKVSEALRRIAETVGATLRLEYTKRVSMFFTPDDATNSIDLTASGTDFWDFKFGTDASQVRSRVIYEGGGAQTTQMVSVGATTIPVDEIGWYSSSGGTVRAKANLITYTGISATSGPGSLTGCSGITEAIAQGESVYNYVTVNDAATQAALATVLGGGLSGVVEQFVQDNRLSLAEITARASQDLALYKNPMDRATYTTTNPYVKPGRTVNITLTSPTSISTAVQVQEQRIKGRRKVDGTITTLALDRLITGQPIVRDLSDTMRRLATKNQALPGAQV